MVTLGSVLLRFSSFFAILGVVEKGLEESMAVVVGLSAFRGKGVDVDGMSDRDRKDWRSGEIMLRIGVWVAIVRSSVVLILEESE